MRWKPWCSFGESFEYFSKLFEDFRKNLGIFEGFFVVLKKWEGMAYTCIVEGRWGSVTLCDCCTMVIKMTVNFFFFRSILRIAPIFN